MKTMKTKIKIGVKCRPATVRIRRYKKCREMELKIQV